MTVIATKHSICANSNHKYCLALVLCDKASNIQLSSVLQPSLIFKKSLKYIKFELNYQ